MSGFMQPQAPYKHIEEVIEDRARWSIALLDGLMQRGRSQGWLDGDVTSNALDHQEAARAIQDRCQRSPLDPTLQPMQWLAIRMQLDEAQCDALWLLSMIDLVPAVTRLAEVFGPVMSVQTLRQLIPLAMEQLDILHRLALIELNVDPAVPHSRRSVRIHDRVLALLQGELDLDREIRDLVTLHAPSREPSPLVVAASERPLVVAVGPDGAGRTRFLAACVGDRNTLRVRCKALSSEPDRLRRQLRAMMREAYLFDAVPILQELTAGASMIEEELGGHAGLVLASATTMISWTHRPVVTHEISRPSGEESRACWREGLGLDDDTVISEIAARYRLWPGAIRSSCRNARSMKADAGLDIEAIHAGVRAHLGDSLRGLATRITWEQTWDDLVLPTDQLGQIAELIARVKHRSEVLDEWGFGAKVGKGHGVVALLSGAPGTGKTMVAGLIARELGLELYQADLSKIVSKYIGETEKQLSLLFDAAETGQAIVLFDEADSLFAKRSEVKSSNDRYANLEVNFLLQRVESFTGIVLLTTNHERSIDEAFRRRLSAHIRFPIPDETQRESLWRAMLPARARVADDIDFGQLACEFDLSGGYIKNAVLRAAFLAAYNREAIAMRHLWTAARMECESLGRLVQRNL